MALRISSVFLVVLIAFNFYVHEAAGATKDPTSADIKKSITAQNAYKFCGIGGTYGRLYDTVSKDKLIESDHFPPKSTYLSANDRTIRAMNERDMGALSLTYAEHRVLPTTGSSLGSQATLAEISKSMSAGKYAQAISDNILIYSEAHLLPKYNKGVLDALEVHQANKLITKVEKDALIKKYNLQHVFDPALEKDPQRLAAIKLIHAPKK